ncbi:hypothetical protein BDY19DRAFT_936105 [Irpex rosettiformis]|uniref:Uncharacterized protein n=1 Tax=Irpex rosettiformis TaxID=378272 RepID=A0ACB8U8Q5_9APHY|nr:hypothetical protein BDY19DRAFT_936105 [Irpex rosettiformis]
MPNVRGRNRQALDDKTSGNTPHTTGKRKAIATPGPHEFLDVGATKKIPAPNFSALDIEDDDDGEQSSLQPKAAGSTPLPLRPQRRALESHPGPSSPPKRRAYSPLPPSSPPSVSSDDLEYENAVPLRVQGPLTPPPELSEAGDENFVEQDNKENEFGNEDEDEDTDEVLPVHFAKLGPEKESSEDDPFGFTALERRLRSQREARCYSFELLPEAQPLRKGKGLIRSRAPLGELSFDRGASTSTLKDRHPTPYHQSDDLEDMYFDPNELRDPVSSEFEEIGENTGTSAPVGLEGLEAEMNEEEQAELAREEQKNKVKAKAKAQSFEPSSSTEEVDPLRTPRPQHVANIYPLRSPFSSAEGTPCDRSLPDSPLSSPSPMKSMAVFHTLPVSSTRKGMLSPAKAGPRPLVELPPSKRRRVTFGKENSTIFDSEKSESSIFPATELEKLVPKRPIVRRSTRTSTAAKTTAASKPRSSSTAASSPMNRGRGRPPIKVEEIAFESTAVPETSEYETPNESSAVTRKRRTGSNQALSKKAKSQVPSSSRAAPTSRRGRPPNSARPISKGKGKAKALPSGFEDEDEDEARKRRERIEYFKKLDEIKLEKEDVFVI